MSKRAFDMIADGLREAAAMARGEADLARQHVTAVHVMKCRQKALSALADLEPSMSSMHQDDSRLPAAIEDCKDVQVLLPVAVGDFLRNLAYVWGVKPIAGESDDCLRGRVRAKIEQARQAETGDGDDWAERHRA